MTDLRMKRVELVLRMWLAWILISNSAVGLITPLEELGLPPHIYHMIKTMWDTGYMMHLVKLTELASGVMILFDLFTPVAILMIVPVLVNIYGMHLYVFHAWLTNGLGMLMVTMFLIIRRRKQFLPLLSLKEKT